MTKLFTNLYTAFGNSHLSLPLAGAILLELLPIWLPSIKPQAQETQKVLLAYGVIAAANSGPTKTQP